MLSQAGCVTLENTSPPLWANDMLAGTLFVSIKTLSHPRNSTSSLSTLSSSLLPNYFSGLWHVSHPNNNHTKFFSPTAFSKLENESCFFSGLSLPSRIKFIVHIADSRPFLVWYYPAYSLQPLEKSSSLPLMAFLLLFHLGASRLGHVAQCFFFFTELISDSSLSSRLKHHFLREGFHDHLSPSPRLSQVLFLFFTLLSL